MSDTALVQLDRARVALSECKTAMEAKQIADVAEAARVYLERTNASAETVNRATEIRLLAERHMGEFLKGMPRNRGSMVTFKGRDSSGSHIASQPENSTPTLKEMGIERHESSRAQKLADIPAPEFHERIAVAKASGGKLSTSKVLKFQWSEEAKRAGEEAAADSEKLWRLKSLWKKTGKQDRARFLAWAKNQ